MGKYFEALKRTGSASALAELPRTSSDRVGELVSSNREVKFPVPDLTAYTRDLAGNASLQRLGEQLAPLASLSNRARLFVGGCRNGDGVSTIAAALAIDLSQRLGLHTVLVDAHFRHPTLHRLMPQSRSASSELVFPSNLAGKRTTWPRLDIVSGLTRLEGHVEESASEIEKVLTKYLVAIFDIGVVRLDSAALALTRPEDPLLLVARYGWTDKREISATVRVLRSANRKAAGVIINGRRDPVPNFIRKIIGRGV